MNDPRRPPDDRDEGAGGPPPTSAEPGPGQAQQPAQDRPVAGPGGRLDPALDPDRYDARAEPVVPGRLDPDRYPGGDGGGRTLTEMLGAGAQEDPRDTYTWLVGLLGVLAFLGLVALVARNLGP